MKAKNTICLWFDKDAQKAARFYRIPRAAPAPEDSTGRPPCARQSFDRTCLP